MNFLIHWSAQWSLQLLGCHDSRKWIWILEWNRRSRSKDFSTEFTCVCTAKLSETTINSGDVFKSSLPQTTNASFRCSEKSLKCRSFRVNGWKNPSRMSKQKYFWACLLTNGGQNEAKLWRNCELTTVRIWSSSFQGAHYSGIQSTFLAAYGTVTTVDGPEDITQWLLFSWINFSRCV